VRSLQFTGNLKYFIKMKGGPGFGGHAGIIY
jgi:hypothetical protein